MKTEAATLRPLSESDYFLGQQIEAKLAEMAADVKELEAAVAADAGPGSDSSAAAFVFGYVVNRGLKKKLCCPPSDYAVLEASLRAYVFEVWEPAIAAAMDGTGTGRLCEATKALTLAGGYGVIWDKAT